MTEIDEYSLAPVPIEQMFDDMSLGTATGFVWRWNARHFLVTNWHVVTARHFHTRENFATHGGRPNKLRVLFNPKSRTFGKAQVDISIVDGDDRPLWLIHPARRLDIALIPLLLQGGEPTLSLNPINALSRQNLSIQIGMDVFILGYPFGPESPAFPVWKRGSIASEPELARLGNDYLLVDTASRPGMSGAPVIRRSWSSHLLEDDDAIFVDSAPHTRFIGIYSGRRHTNDPGDAQLGLVWPESFISEIATAGMRDQY